MGYYKNFNGTDCFEPDNTERELYILSGGLSPIISMDNLLSQIYEHFGHTDVKIEATKIHTRCIHYDLYDSMDYDDYLLITPNE